MTRDTQELQPREEAMELLPSDLSAKAFPAAVPGIAKPGREGTKSPDPSLGLAAYLKKIDH